MIPTTSLPLNEGSHHIRRLFQERLSDIQSRNPMVSLRRFSTLVGLSPGAVSQILHGKRGVSKKMAERICQRLQLSPLEQKSILLAYSKTKTDRSFGDPTYSEITHDQFQVIADWYHFGILSLMRTKDFRDDPTWIAKRLGLSTREAAAALARLERLAIIARDDTGRFQRTVERIRTPDEFASSSIRKNNTQTLQLAAESQNRDPLDLRDLTTVTFAIDTKRIPLAKAAIRRFQDEIAGLVETPDDADEVYRLAIQFFPLTKLPKEGN